MSDPNKVVNGATPDPALQSMFAPQAVARVADISWPSTMGMVKTGGAINPDQQPGSQAPTVVAAPQASPVASAASWPLGLGDQINGRPLFGK